MRFRPRHLRYLLQPRLVLRDLADRRDRRLARRLLERSKGVIHVGANDGAERHAYAKRDLSVLWIEPIPDVFARLSENIARFPKQKALNYLVTETDGESRRLHIASNAGQSSSILDLAEHRAIWPDIDYVDAIDLSGFSLPTILSREGIDSTAYDALVMDTQGSELMILRGAGSLLRQFRFLQSEVADFEVYAGCARRAELTSFLADIGFTEIVARDFAVHPDGGRCFDILYGR
jgi:FkbM family methyltransferase